MTGPTKERLKLAARAAKLRGAGMTNQQVGGRLGVSTGYASTLLADPDGAKQKARRLRYAGTCEVCGKRTDGSGGRENAPRFCVRHSDHGAYTADEVLAMLRRFAEATGRTPTTVDAHATAPSVRERLSDRRRQQLDVGAPPLPSHQTVVRLFGGWREALEEAGLEPVFSGGPVSLNRGRFQLEVLARRAGTFIAAPGSGSRRRTLRALCARGFLTREGRGVRGQPYRYRRTALKP